MRSPGLRYSSSALSWPTAVPFGAPMAIRSPGSNTTCCVKCASTSAIRKMNSLVLSRSRRSPLTSQVSHRSSRSATSSSVAITGPVGAKPGAFFAVQKRLPDATSRFWISRMVISLNRVMPAIWSSASAFVTLWARRPTTNTSSGS